MGEAVADDEEAKGFVLDPGVCGDDVEGGGGPGQMILSSGPVTVRTRGWSPMSVAAGVAAQRVSLAPPMSQMTLNPIGFGCFSEDGVVEVDGGFNAGDGEEFGWQR